ncbi:DUF5320 domain-containing protein [Chloroflexota bacterium]
MEYRYGRGFGRGLGRRGGAELGSRGASPPWPYSGRGRGGLPRCWYPGVAMASSCPPATSFYSPGMTREGEIEFLKNELHTLRAQMTHIEARIEDLRSAESKTTERSK